MQNEELDTPPWLSVARREIGTKERFGNADNPRVLEYLRTCTIPIGMLHDETPWCSAFVNWCVERAGLRGTRRANARSWLSWGAALEQPEYGCVVVFQRGTAYQGHVGFWMGESSRAGFIDVLGGNQANSVCVKPYDVERVLGYRWPSDHA